MLAYFQQPTNYALVLLGQAMLFVNWLDRPASLALSNHAAWKSYCNLSSGRLLFNFDPNQREHEKAQ